MTAMINSISKDKLPKDYCYALKTSQLGDLLAKNNAAIHVDLNYSFSKWPGSILYAYYWLPNNYIPFNRIYIQSSAVHRQDIQAARAAVENTILPAFDLWLQQVFALPENSTGFNTQPTFGASLVNGEIEILNSLHNIEG